MNLFRPLGLALLLASPIASGCDSSVDEEGSAAVTLSLEPAVDGTPLSSDPSTTYSLDGAIATFSTARMYLSEISLVRSDGSLVTFQGDEIAVPAKDADDNDITHSVTDRIVLAKHDLGERAFALGEAPSGMYTGIRYKVGIAGTTNHVDPSQVPAAHPLAKQTDRNNHWSWNAGYMFIRMDGEVDTDGDGTVDERWETHLGTPRVLMEVSLSRDFELIHGQDAEVSITADYGRFLKDVDLTNPDERLCHTMDNLPVTNKVKDAIAGAFTLDGVR